MLWRTIGIALWQRRSTQEKLKSITLPCAWMKCGTGSLGANMRSVPRYLCQVIKVAGEAALHGLAPGTESNLRYNPPLRVRKVAHIPKLNGLSLVVAPLLIACSGELARATEPPTDLCSLLPAAVLSKAVGQTYEAPTATVAPRPFPNTNEGTDCTYKSGEHSFLFRVYLDPSASASADLFAKLKSYFGTGSKDVSGVGDEAYLDKLGGLHVRKGKVRYFLSGTRDSKKLNDLANGIASQL